MSNANVIEVLDTAPGALQEYTSPTSWAAIIAAWESTLRSQRTRDEYGRYVSQFAELLSEAGRGLEDATPADVFAFSRAQLPNPRTGIPGVKPGPAAINVRLAALRSLYAFVIRKQRGTAVTLITSNPADTQAVERAPLGSPTPRGLSTQQARALRDAPPTDTVIGKRDRAILQTLIYTGLRRSELLRLTAGSLKPADDGTPMFRVQVKGGHERYRQMPRGAYRAICEYLEADGRPIDTLDPDARIFPIASKTLYLVIRRYGEQIGVEDLGVHTLRHTAAKLKRETGATLEEVQAFLGHSNVATTARYLQRLEGERDAKADDIEQLLDTVPDGRGE